MATRYIRDSANEHALLRLHENDAYASRLAPIGDNLGRAPWRPSPKGYLPRRYWEDALQEDPADYPSLGDEPQQ
jgi:hypothetical protein